MVLLACGLKGSFIGQYCCYDNLKENNNNQILEVYFQIKNVKIVLLSEVDIMAFDYGYGELNNRLIELFKSGAPDFETAKELINQGADLNAVGKDDGENILSEILFGYWWSEYDEFPDNFCDHCEKENCFGCQYNENPNLGQSMCGIIRFFLDNGFDVTKNEGCFGAQCLYALTLSTFDKYMIEATKILFGAGAVNRTVSLNPNESATPWEFIGTEGSFQGTCEENHALANIFEAVYQVYLALDEGRPYQGIDSYEISVGKRIIKVLAENNGGKSGFPLRHQSYRTSVEKRDRYLDG